MGILDIAFGRIFNSGTELELGLGLDCKEGITATRNGSTRRIDIKADRSDIWAKGYSWTGSDTTVSTGSSPSVQALALNADTESINITDAVLAGYAAEFEHRVAVAKSDGTALSFDVLRYCLYRESGSSEIHLVGISPAVTKVVGTGDQTLDFAGGSSGLDYEITGSYSGVLTVSIVLTATEYIARAQTWRGEPWAVPT